MNKDDLNNSFLVQALQNVFGSMIADEMVRYLEQEEVIQRNGTVNTARLESALRNLLGEASSPILHSLLMVQKKSFSNALK
jgi:hypothetical protein